MLSMSGLPSLLYAASLFLLGLPRLLPLFELSSVQFLSSFYASPSLSLCMHVDVTGLLNCKLVVYMYAMW